MGTTRPDGSEIPRGSGALAALTPERTPTAADFVSASMPDVSSLLAVNSAKNFPTVGQMTQPPAAEDVIPALLSPGEVVLTQEQQREVAEQAGQSPASLFAAAKVPGFDGQAVEPDQTTEKPKSRGERFNRAIGAAAEWMGFSKGGKVPGVGVGDMVQWTINGADQFTEPRKVSQVIGEYALLEGATTGVPVSQLQVHTKAEKPAKSKIGKSATQPQADPEWTKQIEAAIEAHGKNSGSDPEWNRQIESAIDAQDANRAKANIPKPSRGANIANGIQADGGILLSEALPLLNQDSPVTSRPVDPTPAPTPSPASQSAAATAERPNRPKTTTFSDALARMLTGGPPKKPPTITMPIGQAASFPRDVATQTERTGLVDPHPGPVPLPKNLNVSGMNWDDMPREVQALIAKQQPELAKQLQSPAAGHGQGGNSSVLPAPLQGIADQIADMQKRAAKLTDDPNESDPTYKLAKKKTREQRVAEVQASVAAGLLADDGSAPKSKPAPTYKLGSPDLPTLERDNDPYPLQGRKPAAGEPESPNAKQHREIGPIGRRSAGQPSEHADLIHIASRMIGGRFGRGVGIVAQLMGAKPYSREPLVARLGRYLAGGGSNGGSGGDGGPPNPPRGTSSGGDDPDGDGGNGNSGGGRIGQSITSGLSDRMTSGQVIHVWVDGGQIKIDDAAGGAGPAGETRQRASRASGATAASGTASQYEGYEGDQTPIPRSPRRTRERPFSPRVPSEQRSWLGKITNGIGRKLRGVGAVKQRLTRFARGIGGRPAMAGATGRMAGSVAGGMGRAAMSGMGRIAAGGIVGGITSGGAAGGAALGAGAALVAGTGPVGLTLAALAGLAAGLVSVVKGMETFAKSVNESNRSLAQYNGRLSVAFAQLEMQRIMRNLATANATGESGQRLAGAVNELEAAEQPGRIAWQNVKNEAGIVGAEGGKVIAQLTKMADELGGFKAVKIWLDGAMVPLTLANKTLESVNDGIQYLKEWFGGEPHRPKDNKNDENAIPPALAFAAAIAGNDPWKHPAAPGAKQQQGQQQGGGRMPIPPLK